MNQNVFDNDTLYEDIGRDYTWWDSLKDTLWNPVDWVSSLWNTPYSLIGSLFSWSSIDKLHSFVYSHIQTLKIQVDTNYTLGYNFFYSEQRYHDADLLKVLQLALKEVRYDEFNDLSGRGKLNFAQSYQICILYYRELLCNLIKIYKAHQGLNYSRSLSSYDKGAYGQGKRKLLKFTKFFDNAKKDIIEMSSNNQDVINRLSDQRQSSDQRVDYSNQSISKHLKTLINKLSNIEFIDDKSFYNGRIMEVRNKTALLFGCADYCKVLRELEKSLHWVAYYHNQNIKAIIASSIQTHSKYNALSLREV